MSSLKNLKPLFNRVLVRRVKAETQSKGGVLLPESAQKRLLNEGVVVAVGQGARNADGTFASMVLQEGQKVLLPDFGGARMTVEDEEYLLLNEEDILGTLE
ncbi:MAG: hypothetical protein MHM6MM_003901 [Cercozoa sp. M6MM]